MSTHRAEGHATDANGNPVHVDIDPFIPTGVCAICTTTPQETLPPEDREPVTTQEETPDA